MWEALCQAFTIISLITAVLWYTRLSSSLYIRSENCSLKKVTRQRPHTGKRWSWEWLGLTGLQILNPVRLPFCQMIKKIQQDKVFYFGKLKKITNQKANYKKRQWWFMKIKIFCHQTDLDVNSESATDQLCHRGLKIYLLFLICGREVMKIIWDKHWH